jgi:cytochrome c-type biogenesis protein CcsB
MNKLSVSLFSMLTTGVLLILFAISIAYATFIENDFGAVTSKILVYNAWWFEVLLILLSINLIGSIIIHKLISRKKWAIFLFHLGFLVILIGAGATRYKGYEGIVHIREGEETNQLVTSSSYIKVEANSGDEIYSASKEVMFSPNTKNSFNKSFTVNDKHVSLKMLRYVPSATETIVADPYGTPFITIMTMDMFGSRSDFIIAENKKINMGPLNIGFSQSDAANEFSIWEDNGRLLFMYSQDVELISMGESEGKVLEAGISHDMVPRTVYRIGHLNIVLKEYFPKGKIQLISVPSHKDHMSRNAILVNVNVDNKSSDVVLYESVGDESDASFAEVNGVSLKLKYGRIAKTLPFTLRLNEFHLERYPGSNSPSSFASEVTLIDKEENLEMPYRIFMNNILKYKGYRFFQSSYDKDEMGTILSVNYDSLGTNITYFGYFIMTLGMVLTLFARGSRFLSLARASYKLRLKREKLFISILAFGLLFSGTSVFAQNKESVVSKEHAKAFGKLQVQNVGGRIEPVNTMASKLLRKVYGKNNFDGLNPVQFFLEVTIQPELWLDVPLIKVSNNEVKRALGVNGDFATFHNMFNLNMDGDYKLSTLVEAAYNKKPGERNKFDKEIINLDERVNVFYMILNWNFLTIIPIPNSADNKWVDIADALQQTDTTGVGFAAHTLMSYRDALRAARLSGDYSSANQILQSLIDNQRKHGSEIYPSELKTKLEIFYINFNLYSKLSRLYILAGLFLLVLQFSILLRPKFKGKFLSLIGFWFVLFLFAVHTSGLGVRWYISGHAPWSNGYETLLYISWSACLAGLVFARRSPMTLAITTVLAAITLFVAGMSWMNPELTNLVPVLKSYWLIIHVAIITASYGFLGMGALLGLANLIMIILRNPKNKDRIDFTIKELVYIIQMALIVGLFMLTIGSFLGGVWANESWGRYWGWDPKETWALVTILVYTFITHMHKIKGFETAFAVCSLSLVGFSSVLMTFFGVNYYLSGLHSYAQGDPPPVPKGVYIAILVILFIVGLAYNAQRTQKLQLNEEDFLNEDNE